MVDFTQNRDLVSSSMTMHLKDRGPALSTIGKHNEDGEVLKDNSLLSYDNMLADLQN